MSLKERCKKMLEELGIPVTVFCPRLIYRHQPIMLGTEELLICLQQHLTELINI